MSAEDEVPGEDHGDGPGSVDRPPVLAGPTVRPGGDASFVPPVTLPASKNHHRSLIIAIIGVVVVIVLVAAEIVTFDEASAAISTGSGTATFTWVPPTGDAAKIVLPPRTFTGSIGGKTVTGRIAVRVFTSGHSTLIISAPPASTVVSTQYKGSFGGRPFVIVQSDRPNSTNPAYDNPPSDEGTYDGRPVHAMLGEPSGLGLTSSVTHLPGTNQKVLPFFGAIGTWQVTGVIHLPTGNAKVQTAMASYAVSS